MGGHLLWSRPRRSPHTPTCHAARALARDDDAEETLSRKRGQKAGIARFLSAVDNDVQDQAERADLVLLSFFVSLPELSSVAMKDPSRQGVPSFLEICLRLDEAAIGLVVRKPKDVQSLLNPSVVGNRIPSPP